MRIPSEWWDFMEGVKQGHHGMTWTLLSAQLKRHLCQPALCIGTKLTQVQANSLVNAAIEDFSIDKLGVVVMDELHMIDDESRGYILELMATKLLTLQIEDKVQLIGMSATLNVCKAPLFLWTQS
jgi:hypothetical protein